MLRHRTAVPTSIALATLLFAGCPQPQDTSGNTRVNAVIGISSTTGAPPLTVVVTAADSSSSYFGPLTYAWDFADGATSADMQTTHTFTEAGLYRVTLRVTDAGGVTGVATADVRVQGGAVVAVIATDVTAGPAPLAVQFDGTQSVANGDTIRDYLWDFDDGSTSVQAKPRHTFRFAGTYAVKLTIRSAGGVEASTAANITVGETQDSSLQFDGASSATLPFGSARSFTEFTVETWVKAQSDGGNVLTMGASAAIELVPAGSLVRIRVAGQPYEFAAAGLADTWRHIALVVASGAGADPNTPSRTATVYLDGVPLGNATLPSATYGASNVIIGNGLRGKLAEVRVWSAARSATDIASSRTRRITASAATLVGAWPLSDGTGQTLDNAVGSSNGFLGNSTSADGADPAWSSDAPPL